MALRRAESWRKASRKVSTILQVETYFWNLLDIRQSDIWPNLFMFGCQQASNHLLFGLNLSRIQRVIHRLLHPWYHLVGGSTPFCRIYLIRVSRPAEEFSSWSQASHAIYGLIFPDHFCWLCWLSHLLVKPHTMKPVGDLIWLQKVVQQPAEQWRLRG